MPDLASKFKKNTLCTSASKKGLFNQLLPINEYIVSKMKAKACLISIKDYPITEKLFAFGYHDLIQTPNILLYAIKFAYV